MNLIENNSQKIIALCKKHKVGKLFVFGSILTDRFNDDSQAQIAISVPYYPSHTFLPHKITLLSAAFPTAIRSVTILNVTIHPALSYILFFILFFPAFSCSSLICLMIDFS